MATAVAKAALPHPRTRTHSPSAPRPPPRAATHGPSAQPVPGILHLPAHKTHSPARSPRPSPATVTRADATAAASAPEGDPSASPARRRTRARKPKPSQEDGSAPATPQNGASSADSDDPSSSARPRRGSPLKSVVISPRPLATPPSPLTSVDPSPSPSKRRRPRPNHQRSPPRTDADGDSSAVETALEPRVDSAATTTTRATPVPLPLPLPLDPYADNPAMSLLSRSAPTLGLLAFPSPGPPTPVARRPSPLSSASAHHARDDGAAWDMPTVARGAKSSAESLTWQQASFQTSQPSTPRTRTESTRRPQSARAQGQQPFATQQQQQKARSSAQASDSAPSPSTPSAGGLTWQQRELLQPRHGHANSFSGVPSDLPSSLQTAATATPPQRNARRNQLRDAETFGLDAPAPFAMDDLFAPPSPSSGSGPRSPTKAVALSTEMRYAGPTFHNSPAPEALPVPSFVLRRQLRLLAL